MFEAQQDIVDSLLHENHDFSRIHNKYADLKNQINLANQGKQAIDELSLEQLKKQKLKLKDQMASMITDYKRREA